MTRVPLEVIACERVVETLRMVLQGHAIEGDARVLLESALELATLVGETLQSPASCVPDQVAANDIGTLATPVSWPSKLLH